MPRAAEHWTADMLSAFPDGARRYELISGELVMTPAPSYLHQAVGSALLDRLQRWVENAGIGEALGSPADISLGEDALLQPDIFAFRRVSGAPTRSWIDISALVLAIEVLSPSTARYDRTLKPLRYQRAGVPPSTGS